MDGILIVGGLWAFLAIAFVGVPFLLFRMGAKCADDKHRVAFNRFALLVCIVWIFSVMMLLGSLTITPMD